MISLFPEVQKRPSRQAWRGLMIILAVQFVLGMMFVVVFPPFDQQDEVIHWEVVEFIRDNGRIPSSYADVSANPIANEFHQPPLYYVMAALITAPIPSSDPPISDIPVNNFGINNPETALPDNATMWLHDPEQTALPGQGDWLSVRVLRVYSVILGLLATVFAFWMAWFIFEDELLVLGMICWIALRPSVIALNARLSNDPQTFMLVTIILMLCALIIVHGSNWKRAISLGIVLGLAAMSRISWAAMALAAPLAFFLTVTWREDKKQSMIQMVAAGAVSLVIAGWWFVRNMINYGDPLGLGLGANSDLPSLLWEREYAIAAWEFGYWGKRFIRDYWAAFGVRAMPIPMNTIFAIITALLLIGLAYLLISKRLKETTSSQKAAGFVMGIAALYMIQIIIAHNFLTYGFKARFIFSGYTALALVMHLGLVGLVKLSGLRWQHSPRLIALIPALFLIPLTLYAIFGVLAPSYAVPRRVDDVALLADEYDTPADVVFGDIAHLVGFSVDRRSVKAGEFFHVTLCWETLGASDVAIPYGLHLIDGENNKVAEVNTHPGLGRYATSYWEVGGGFCDEVRVDVAADVAPQQVYQLTLRYFDEKTLAVLPATMGNGVVGDIIYLAEVAVLPDSWADPGDSIYHLGEGIDISALEIKTTEETLSINIRWVATSDINNDYTAFLHLIGADGQVVAQIDIRPDGGRFPTLFWVAGMVLDDQIDLSLAGISPGGYQVMLGMYDSQTVIRLPVTDAAGNPIQNDVMIVGEFDVQ